MKIKKYPHLGPLPKGEGIKSPRPFGEGVRVRGWCLYCRLEDHPVSLLGVLRELVEVQIAIGIHRRLIYLSHKGLVLFRRWQFANQRRNRCQLRRSR